MIFSIPPEIEAASKELESVLEMLGLALLGEPNEGQIVVPAQDRLDDSAREQARYKALVENIPAITFTLSLEFGPPELYVGPQIERILGFTQEEWTEDPILWFNQCHPEDREIWHGEFARGIEKGGPFQADCRVFAKNGDIKWLHCEAVLVRDDLGRPLFLQGVVFDVTEAKEAERKMKEAQQLKVLNERLSAVGQMAASIGHDLRNPLGAIRIAWFYIKTQVERGNDLRADPRFEKMGAVIDREIGQCQTILSELMEFSRDRPPYKVACPLGPLVDDAVEVVRKPAPTQRIINEIPDDLQVPHLDTTQFRQVLVNLIQNAAEAIGPKGVVRIRAEYLEENDQVQIEVIDNGKGIPKELQENIWKPLFTTKTKGTGLGLSIVANIVQRHTGTVFTKSAPGQGSTFQLRIPIDKPSDGPAPDTGGAVEVKYLRERELNIETVSIKELVDEVFEVVAKPHAGMQLVNEIEDKLPPVEVDRVQFRQALVNLVQNGLEAIGPSGWVKVAGGEKDGICWLKVEDNGGGVLPEQLEEVWKPLYTTKTKGTGLGLPSARAAIERHRGSIRIDSSPAVGTLFEIQLPMKQRNSLLPDLVQGGAEATSPHDLAETVIESYSLPGPTMSLLNDVPQNLQDHPLDAHAVHRVLTELVHNALEAVGPEGTVRINGRVTSDGALIFDVDDDGEGITSERIETVFERGVSSKGRAGSGLAAAKAYAESIGGQLSVKSAAGQGSTFSLRIPTSTSTSKTD